MMIVLACILGALVMILTVLTLAFFRMARKIKEYENAFYDFILPEKTGEPSRLANLIDSMAAVLSSRLITSFQASLRGTAGGTASGEAKAARAEALANNPLLGILGGSKLGKNPLAMMALQGVLGGGFAKTGSNGHTESPKFDL